jgi:hypothetical protein
MWQNVGSLQPIMDRLFFKKKTYLTLVKAHGQGIYQSKNIGWIFIYFILFFPPMITRYHKGEKKEKKT